MKPRDPDRRVRLHMPGPWVTRAISPVDLERYLLAKGWRRVPAGQGPIPDVRDRTWSLTRIVHRIAELEGRSAGAVLCEVDAMARFARSVAEYRKRKKWRVFVSAGVLEPIG